MRDRLNIIAGALLLAVLAVFVLGKIFWEFPVGPSSHVAGTVGRIELSFHSNTPKPIVRFDVRLDNTKIRTAKNNVQKVPAEGDRVVLREQANVFGYHHYHWDGLTLETPQPAPSPVLQ